MTEDDPVSYQWFGCYQFHTVQLYDLAWFMLMYVGIGAACISYNIAMLWFHDLTTCEVVRLIILWLFDLGPRTYNKITVICLDLVQ